MLIAKGERGDSSSIYGYCDGPERGYFCLLDADIVAIPVAFQAASADTPKILEV